MLDTSIAPRLYSVKEAASLLNVSEGLVRKLIHTRKLRAVRLGRNIRISDDEIARIVKKGAPLY